MLKDKNLDFSKLKQKDKIELICDYCQQIFTRKYTDHLTITKRDSYIKKDSCARCSSKKQKEIISYKNENGLLKRGDKGYYQSKENVLKELNNFIKELGHAHIHKHPKGHDIYMGIISRKDGYGLMDAILDLGYDFLDVLKSSPKGYLENFSVLEKYIRAFIDKFERFPNTTELNRDIGISNSIIKKHGGIYELKRKMNYIDKEDLVDDRNFMNKSVYEYTVAQFLIKNEIPYKREQYPFEGYLYKSDFTFYPFDEEEIHVEVWGFRDEGHGEEYNIRKREKKRLYELNGMRLIEIENTIFENYNHKNIQKYLEKTFSEYFNLKYKDLDYKFFISSKLSDKELFEKIMSVSDNNELPRIDKIKKYNASLYVEMLNRFGNYANFALHFNMIPFEKHGYWNKEIIHKHLLEMVNKGEELSQNNIKKTRGLFKAMISHKGMSDTKLEFFNENLHLFSQLNQFEITWLERVIRNSSSTPSQKEQAKQILDKLINLNISQTPISS